MAVIILKILFISLGCDKNLVDSEVMLGLLKKKDMIITDDENEADVIVINTCCFIHDAKEESIETILEMAKLKETGKLKALLVAGCLAQRYKEEIIKEIPQVDAVIGTTAIDEIDEILNSVLKGIKKNYFNDMDYLPKTKVDRVITTGGYTSYLKIAEGCDKHCTYCIIPKLRGKFRSVPMEDLIEEAKYLVENGVKELILVAQETTLYGVDLYGKKMLPELLRKLAKIEELEWIRLLYCYPEEITDELIQVMKEEDKVCKYIDMPIQHASDKILKKMGRRTSKAELVEIINKIRSQIEDVVIRTTLITGFPTESDEDFEELMDFVYDMNFERLGVFTYSREEDTPAANFEGQVDEAIKEERKESIMAMQQDIAFDFSSEMINRVVKVIIEGYIDKDDVYVARSYMDAPSIDGLVFVKSDRQLMSGDFVLAQITNSDGYDLIAEAI